MEQGRPPERLFRLDRRDLFALLALAVLAVIILWPMLTAGKGMAPGMPGHDGRTQWYPWRAYAADWIGRGTLPLWNPDALCGTPFLGNAQSALFYAPNLLFVVLPVHMAARLLILLHLWAALLFTYLLSRSLNCNWPGAMTAALAFGFGSSQLLRVPAGHWGVSCAVVWLPLIMLCAEALARKPGWTLFGIGAMAVAMQVLSGVPQIVFISGLAVAAYAVLRTVRRDLAWPARLRRWGAVAAMLALGAATAGVQLLPGIEAAQHGARTLPMRDAWLDQFSLAPESLLTLVNPTLFGGTGSVPWWGRYLSWEMVAYAGVLTFALALIGLMSRRDRRLALPLAGLALLALLLALGRHTPLMGFMKALPFVGDMFRGAAKFLLPFQLALALLAGLGMRHLLEAEEEARGRVVIVLGLLFLLCAVVFGVLLTGDTLEGLRGMAIESGEHLNPAVRSIPADSLRRPALVGAVVSLALLLLLGAVAFMLNGRTRGRLVFLVVLFIAADMLLFARAFIRSDTNFRAECSWPDAATVVLSEKVSQWRTWTVGNPNLNDGMLVGVPTVEGIEPNPPVWFHMLFRVAQNQPVDIAPSMYQVLDPESGGLMQRTALGNIVSRRPLREAEDLIRQYSDEEGSLYAVEGVLPRAVVVEEEDPAESKETGLALSSASSATRLPARIVGEDPNMVVVKTESGDGGWLVLRDNYYPGWQARVDGAPVPIRRADIAFRAVPVPAGEHLVTFAYVPASLKWGMGLSLAGLVMCAVCVIVGRRVPPPAV